MPVLRRDAIPTGGQQKAHWQGIVRTVTRTATQVGQPVTRINPEAGAGEPNDGIRADRLITMS
jgi:hypothetical protein